jgi:hypothetical protein
MFLELGTCWRRWCRGRPLWFGHLICLQLCLFRWSDLGVFNFLEFLFSFRVFCRLYFLFFCFLILIFLFSLYGFSCVNLFSLDLFGFFFVKCFFFFFFLDFLLTNCYLLFFSSTKSFSTSTSTLQSLSKSTLQSLSLRLRLPYKVSLYVYVSTMSLRPNLSYKSVSL